MTAISNVPNDHGMHYDNFLKTIQVFFTLGKTPPGFMTASVEPLENKWCK